MRLTRREMEEQYPNQWLGITNEEFAEVNGGMGIIAADVVYVNADPSDLALMSMKGEKIRPLFTTPDQTFHIGALM